MENNKKNEINNRIQLSLASIMFFSIFVKYILKKGHLKLEEKDKKFILGYVRFGNLNLLFLILTIISMALNYLMNNIFLYRIYTISVFAILGMLILGTILVLGDVYIFQGANKGGIKLENVKTDKGNIFLSFIPIYNVFLWYKLNEFKKPYRRAKESLLRRTLFIFISFFSQNIYASGFIGAIIIIRIITLMSGVDFLDNNIKQKISKLFLVNTEELAIYPISIIEFSIKKLSKGIHSKLSEIIIKNKEKYSKLYDLEKKLIIQYFLGTIILGLWVYIARNTDLLFQIAIILFILLKYFITYKKTKKLPLLPIINEICEIF